MCLYFRFQLFAAAMQIFVHTLDDRTLALNVQSDDTVNDVKELVEQHEGKLTYKNNIHLFQKIFSRRYSCR